MRKIRPEIAMLGGYKCDTPGCDYKEERHDYKYVEDYIQDLEEHLTLLCPKCGGRILTMADYKSALLLIKLLHNPFIVFLDRVCSLFLKRKRYHFGMNGSGQINIEEVEVTK
jgi:DNA-directed RNA polymerase subunit RPC12/RpoP